MNWIESLYQTYDNCSSRVGIPEDGVDDLLLPLSHTTQNASIEVTLDGEGNFVKAKVIPKKKQKTLVPCTERSGGRAGSKPTSHPLCDKLQYLAGDFLTYGGIVTSGFAKNPTEPHQDYLKLLSDWQERRPHRKVEAVIKYVKKAQLIKDLSAHGIIPIATKESGKDCFLLTWSKGGGDAPGIFSALPAGASPQDGFVRWSVQIPGDMESNLWEDPTVWESWNEYYKTTQDHSGLCYVTGENTTLAVQHPAKLRHAADKAKLISSNDSSGFTFRGRFSDPDGLQTAAVGFDVTQKAHNALRWLISRQGRRLGDQAIVSWAINGHDIPDALESTLGLVSDDEDDLDAILEQEHYQRITDKGELANTGQTVAQALNLKLAGYKASLGDTTKIIVLTLDSATPGRMAVTYYRELTASEFLKRIERWHEESSWLLYHNKGRKFVGAPSPFDIAQTAYGKRLDDKLKSATYRRLLPCIIENRPIPDDIVIACIRRASSRITLEGWEWEKALGIACALYRKQQSQKNNRFYTMSLDTERNSRDYLYGRLLAVADVLEQAALSKEENRPTNSARMMQRFSMRPFTTWTTLYERLEPYRRRLKANKPGLLHRYETELDAIKNLFVVEDFRDDTKLDGEYLLSYHCQRSALYTKKSSKAASEGTDIDPSIQ
ncbi:MAG: type I-C CRISPR-associated protein Cas8c/Csd1 [Verrucomicrobiales bacterium]